MNMSDTQLDKTDKAAEKLDQNFDPDADTVNSESDTSHDGAEECDGANEEALRVEEVRKRITKLAEETSDNPLSLAKLDFETLRPYIQTINVLMYLGAAGFLAFTTGSLILGALAGLLLGTLYIGYPFAIDEKYERRALYLRLGLRSSSLVLGRYLFSLLFTFVVAVTSAIFAFIGHHFSQAGMQLFPELGTADALLLVLFSYWIIMAIQLMLYFRYGFSKARLVGTLPMIAAIVAVAYSLMGT
jgi:hypothetical protein